MITDKITIAIPVYERIDFFEEALNSALSQTVSCPVYVIDNASTHNKFQEIVEKQNNSLVTYIRNEKNLGMIGNWNRCIDVCQTEYLSILHDDDVLHPGFVECCLKFLSKNPSQKCCFAVSTVAGKDSSVFLHQHVRKEKNRRFKKINFLFGNLVAFPGVLFPVTIAKKTGGFKEEEYPLHDFDFWIRLSDHIPLFVSNLPYAFYRKHSQQTSAIEYLNFIDKFYERRQRLFSNLLGFFWFFSMWSLYCSYINNCNYYNSEINIGRDIKNPKILRWFIFFRKTSVGLLRYIYIYSCRIFIYLVTRIS